MQLRRLSSSTSFRSTTSAIKSVSSSTDTAIQHLEINEAEDTKIIYFQEKIKSVRNLKETLEQNFGELKFEFNISACPNRDCFTVYADPTKIIHICEFVSSNPSLIILVHFNAATL